MEGQETQIAGDETVDTSYEPFSHEPEYIDVNRLFLRTLPLDPSMYVLDLACGTGTMTDLLFERVAERHGAEKGDTAVSSADGLCVLGVDLSRESLLLAQDHLGALPPERRRSHTVSLIEGMADCLPIADQTVDLAVMGNAIQLIERRDVLFKEIHRVLRPGGLFAFNTSFYAGTYVPGTEHVYTHWIQQALAYIRERDAELCAAGLPGVTRKRGLAARAFSRPWLSPAEYGEEMQRQGLITQSVSERTVMLTQRCFETIGAYAGLARVLLSGYPVRLACEALEKAAGPTLAALEVKAVPRYWLEMVAQKWTA